MSELDKIKEKVRALLSKTTQRGCTEAEADAAAVKAAALMAEYGLAREHLDIGTATGHGTAGKRSIRSRLWGVIGNATNCQTLLDGHGDRVVYVGAAPGPEIAAYLMQVCDRAIDRESRAFRATTWYKRRRTLRAKRAASDDFVDAMITRLGARIVKLFEASRDRAALEAARAAAQSLFQTTPVNLREAADRYSAARARGWIAGGDVTIAHGVAGDAPKRIGGGS